MTNIDIEWNYDYVLPHENTKELVDAVAARINQIVDHNLTSHTGLDVYLLGWLVINELQIAMAERIPDPDFRLNLILQMREGAKKAATAPICPDGLPKVVEETENSPA